MKEIDWSNLSFGYMKTDYNVRINFREGEWGKLEISSSELINLHMAATCLHYGQEAFEGLKAFFIPPYESGASLYIRPLLIGTGAQVGVRPSNEYMFLIFVTPVGPYFKGGFAATPYVITRKYDRAAPLGTGIYKIGGNYAASLRASHEAHAAG